MSTWILNEAGYDYDTVEADSAEEALEEARENVDAANYPGEDGDGLRATIWVGVSVRCEETDEHDSDSVRCDPPEPRCTESEHDWASPHAIVGGLRENPGVWGHGGGVVVHEVCVHCGCKRTTDTWAQDPTNGRQGLESVSYEPGRYAKEIADHA